MKKILLLFILFVSFQGFSQKDSIVNYLDKKGKITKDKEKARSFEIVTKKLDSLWLVRKYRRNGKLFNYTHYLSANKKIKIGESVSFNKHGKMNVLNFYNKEGRKHGRAQTWFDNGNKNIEGIYLEGKREGVWKLYHYNGKLASKGVFKKDSLLKTSFYNSLGNKIEFKYDDFKIKKPKFKVDNKKYVDRLKKLVKSINYKVKGKINVYYVIDVDGKIKDVTIDEKLPKKLKKQIITFFENIEGWVPATHLNRIIPFNFTQPLNFRG
ncbi:toxin-antitoxin system YwqK family antitoxin [Tenacibaculum ovolyticum]|uniref:toxin-antitoxin system YwqK family antitoxin n=1 Tax=Tenacibaculum ovolyticum TaxID=104270 RepID=UPI00041F62DB|nr:hypothetical protein [Tenacibaculum ovolyticum]